MAGTQAASLAVHPDHPLVLAEPGPSMSQEWWLRVEEAIRHPVHT